MANHFKVNCFSGPSINSRAVANEIYKGITDLLNAMTASSTTTRIAFNTGSVAGSGNGQGYHDQPNAFGRNAWSCYRFNSTDSRPWDWYFLIQYTSGAGNFGDAPGNPGLVQGTAESQGSSEGTIAVAMAAMVTTGGLSVNPWNGTTNNDGNDSKGDPVWQTGGTGDRLFVLPRSNSEDGAHASSRENMARIFNSTTSAATILWHLAASEDGIVIASDFTISNTFNLNFFGVYEPLSFLTASIPTPMVLMGTDMDSTNTPDPGTDIGVAAGNGSSWEGGVTTQNGSVTLNIDAPTTVVFTANTRRPSPFVGNTTYDEWAIIVAADDSTRNVDGPLGYINTDLLRMSYYGSPGSVSFDQSRFMFGDTATRSDYKYTMPWTGSLTLPRGSKSREGEQL